MKKFLIAPSLLSANFAKLGEEAHSVIQAGGDLLHLDIMDNHYVPNLTMGPQICKGLRQYGISAPLDVHLMVKPVDQLIVDFAAAGATNITFHPEASEHVDRSLALIRQHGCKAGLALNPATTWHCLEHVLDKIDIILVMSVNPGFGGQTFIRSSLDKIKQIKEYLNELKSNIVLAVDGGIKVDNIAEAAQAGATMFIAGSAIFDHPPYATTIQKLRAALELGDHLRE